MKNLLKEPPFIPFSPNRRFIWKFTKLAKLIYKLEFDTSYFYQKYFKIIAHKIIFDKFFIVKKFENNSKRFVSNNFMLYSNEIKNNSYLGSK